MLKRLAFNPVESITSLVVAKSRHFHAISIMQAHQSRGNPRPHGGGDRRGNGRPFQQRQNLPSVPSKAQVIPGAAVSIVLKQDQPTGREVTGIVQDVLTGGDHPRGIKVRLTDGRVGRVQRMSSNTSNSQVAPAASSEFQVVSEGNQPSSRQQMRYRDVRLEEEPEAPPSTYDLSAFIKVAKPKKKAVAAATPVTEAPTATPDGPPASCPVCGSFEGDEAAVAHHVENHFT